MVSTKLSLLQNFWNLHFHILSDKRALFRSPVSHCSVGTVFSITATTFLNTWDEDCQCWEETSIPMEKSQNFWQDKLAYIFLQLSLKQIPSWKQRQNNDYSPKSLNPVRDTNSHFMFPVWRWWLLKGIVRIHTCRYAHGLTLHEHVLDSI
jgi:hypothetical protein